MKTSAKLATSLSLSAVVILGSGSVVRAEGTRTVGVVAIIMDGSNVTSLSSSIAVGKTAAAGTASINGKETATSAIAGGGKLTVTNPGTTDVGYTLDAESPSSLGTAPTAPTQSKIQKVDSNSNSKVITIIP